MKKLTLILSAAVCLLAACSKSKTITPVVTLTPANATVKDITAKWLATVDTSYTISNNQTTVTFSGNPDGLYFQFNADGTGVEGFTANPSQPFTYTLKNGTIILHAPAIGGNPSQDSDLIIDNISSNSLQLSVFATDNKQVISFVRD